MFIYTFGYYHFMHGLNIKMVYFVSFKRLHLFHFGRISSIRERQVWLIYLESYFATILYYQVLRFSYLWEKDFVANSLKVDKEIIWFQLLCVTCIISRHKKYMETVMLWLVILVCSMASHIQMSMEATNSFLISSLF